MLPEFKSYRTRAQEDRRVVEECKTEMLEEDFSRPTNLAQHLAMMAEVVEVMVADMEEGMVEDMVEVEAGPDPGLAVVGAEITTGTPGLTEG